MAYLPLHRNLLLFGADLENYFQFVIKLKKNRVTWNIILLVIHCYVTNLLKYTHKCFGINNLKLKMLQSLDKGL